MPPPPNEPGELCSDTCHAANNGECNQYPDDTECEYGTDCTDCGIVGLCPEDDCGSECRALGLSLGSLHYCYTAAYGDGECHDSCNNWQCQHDAGDCSTDDKIARCALGHGAGMAHIKSKPANTSSTMNVTLGSNDTEALALIEVQFTDMEPFTLTLDQDTSAWSMNLETNLRLRWRDSRLRTVACRDVLSDLLDIRSSAQATERVTKENNKAFIWFPRIHLGGKDLVYLQDAVTQEAPTKEAAFSFTAGDGGPWLAYTDTNTTQEADLGEGCWDCAEFNLEAEVSFKIRPTPTFEFYPFDEQQFDIRVSIAEADIFTCTSIIDVEAMGGIGALLPTTNEFKAQGLDLFHPVRSDGQPDRSTCVIRFRVRRNPVIFWLKQILPSIFVTMSGLCALLLDAVDHTGDRTATILVAALILVVNFQTDLGLGSITYITWWDAFNLTCLTLLAVVLAESLYEHILCQTHRRGVCIQINRVSRIILPLGFAPLVLIWIILVGMRSNWSDPLAWSLLIAGNLCVFTFGTFLFSRINSRINQKREKIKAMLRDCDPRSDILPWRLQAAFHAYDLDGSGTLDMDEVRELVQVLLKGRCKPIAFTEMMLNLRSFGDADGHLTLPSFADAITHSLGQLGLVSDDDQSAASLSEMDGREFSKRESITSIRMPMGPWKKGKSSKAQLVCATASDPSTPAQAKDSEAKDTATDSKEVDAPRDPARVAAETQEGSTRRRHRHNGPESELTTAKSDPASATKVRGRRQGTGKHHHHHHRQTVHEV